MGGFGSTRWRWQSTKWCVEDCGCLDIDKLIAAGLLQHDRGYIECLKGEGKTTLMRFTLKPSGDPKCLYLYLFFAGGPCGQQITCEPIPIEMRPQRIGKRYFFRCHLLCASRVRKLYRPTARDTWGCRRCHKLTYRSCQQHDKAMDMFRGNAQLVLTALNAGSFKAALFVLRSRVFRTREPNVVKVFAQSAGGPT